MAEAITAASTDDKEKKFGNVFTLISEMPGHKVADRRESLTVLPLTMVPRGYKDSQKVLSFPGLASGQKNAHCLARVVDDRDLRADDPRERNKNCEFVFTETTRSALSGAGDGASEFLLQLLLFPATDLLSREDFGVVAPTARFMLIRMIATHTNVAIAARPGLLR